MTNTTLIEAIIDAIAEAVIRKTSLQKADKIAIDQNTTHLRDQIDSLERRIEALESNAESDSSRIARISDHIDTLEGRVDVIDSKADDFAENLDSTIESAIRDVLRDASVTIDI